MFISALAERIDATRFINTCISSAAARSSRTARGLGNWAIISDSPSCGSLCQISSVIKGMKGWSILKA